MRVGIVGTESSHVDHIIDYLNVDKARPGIRVTALAGGEEVRNQGLCRAGGIDLVAGDVTALLDVADVLIVTARHGAIHRDLALPFLEAGRPVLVDKPFACDMADAEAMLRAAEEHGTLVTSYSALRYLPATEALAKELQTIGPVRSVVTTGPADETSEYGGIFFYGIHPVDVALRLAPGSVGQVRMDRVGESIVASATVGDAQVTVNLIKPGPHGPVPFHALAVGRGGIAIRELRTDGNYVAYGLAAFFDMIEGTVPPLSRDELLRPITFLEAVDRALRSLHRSSRRVHRRPLRRPLFDALRRRHAPAGRRFRLAQMHSLPRAGHARPDAMTAASEATYPIIDIAIPGRSTSCCFFSLAPLIPDAYHVAHHSEMHLM